MLFASAFLAKHGRGLRALGFRGLGFRVDGLSLGFMDARVGISGVKVLGLPLVGTSEPLLSSPPKTSRR